MDYLFNINIDDSSELHEVLGMIDSDFSMIQLFPYIRKSTKELIKWIGKENYNTAIEAYKKEVVEDEFLQLCRYAVAMGAFKEFAPLSDISFTTQGRSFRSDENMKAAFEWQIDKSDGALERSYYSALNEVIEFLLSNKEEQTDEEEENKYSLSPKLKQIDDLFVNSIDVFQDYVNINDSHLLYFMLIPSLRRAQTQLIKPRIAQNFNELKADKEKYIFSIICAICVYYAMADGIEQQSIQLFPKGVFKNETKLGSKYTSTTVVDTQATILYYKNEIQKLLISLENEVAASKQKPIAGPTVNFNSDDKFISI